MLPFRATSLRFRLLLLVVLSMLPIFGLMLHHALMERDRQLRAIQEEAVRMAELAAGGISKVVEGSRELLHALSHTEAVRTMNVPEATPLFAELIGKSEFYLNIGLVRPDGLIVASGAPLEEPVYITERSYFARVSQTGIFTVSEYLVGKVTGRGGINIGYPLPGQPGEPLAGVVYASLDLRKFQECISLPQLPPGSVILVTDRNGIYLARTPGNEKWVGRKAQSWQALQARGGTLPASVEAVGVDGIARTYHYVPVPGSDNGILVAVGVSKAGVLAEVRSGFLRNMRGLGLCTLASLLGAWLVGDLSLLKHVRQLTHAAQQLAAGNWNAPTGIKGGPRELRQFSQAFESMAATLRQNTGELEKQVKQRTAELRAANRALEEKQAHLAEAQRIGHMGSWHRDLLTGTLTCSREVRRIFGLGEDAPVTFETFLRCVHPDDMGGLREQQLYAGDGCDLVESEYRIVRPDGEVRHIHECCHFGYSPECKLVKMEGIIQDITERKLIESERERIIEELTNALAEVKTLTGLLPICSGCKKIRDDGGRWSHLESYISARSQARFSHGFCPDCARIYFPELEL